MQRWWIVWVVLLALGCESREEQLAQHQERAAAYFEDEQWFEAKIEYLNLLQIDPTNADAQHQLALVHGNLAEFGEALWRLQEAVRLAPDDVDMRVELAGLLLAGQRRDDARGHIDALLESDPKNADGLLLLARHLAGERDREALESVLDRLFEVEPDSVPGLGMRAQLASRDRNYGAAEAALRRIVEVDPKAGSHLLLALFLGGRERPEEAREAYERAVEAADEDAVRLRARLALASFLMAQEEFDAAEKALLEAREEAENQREVLGYLARFYYVRGQAERAVEMIEEVANQSPDDPGPRLALAEFLRRTGSPDRAGREIDRALMIDPHSEAARLMRSEFLLEVSPTPASRLQAREILAEVLAENPRSLAGLFTEAKFLLTEKQPEEAAQRLLQVIQEQPSANAHLLLGSAYQQMEQYDLARAELLKAVQLDASNSLARVQLAAIYLHMKSHQMALQEAEVVLERDERNATALLVLAESLQVMERKDEAVDALDRLREANWDAVGEPELFRLRAASIHQRMGQVEAARQWIDQVLEANPTHVGAARQLRNLLILSGKPADALAPLDRAIALAPKSADLLELRAELRLGFRNQDDRRLRYPAEVEEDLQRALEIDPDRAGPHVLMGKLHEGRGEPDLAAESYREAIRREPTGPQAYLRLAGLLQGAGRKSEAAQVYQDLVTARPDHCLAKNNLAWLLAETEHAGPAELDRAQGLAQDAKECMQGNPEVADTLGFVMLRKGIPRAAISLFKEALGGERPAAAQANTRHHLALAYEQAGEVARAIEELTRALSEAKEFGMREEAEALLARLRSS